MSTEELIETTTTTPTSFGNFDEVVANNMSSGGNVSESSLADVDAGLKVLMENADSFFLIIMGIIVFLMQIGFAFLEAGAVWYAEGHKGQCVEIRGGQLFWLASHIKFQGCLNYEAQS